MPNDRPRRLADEPVMLVRKRPEKAAEAPVPSTAELIQALTDRIAEADSAAQARHAELLQRLTALDAAVSRAEDAAGCAGNDATEAGKRLSEELSAAHDDLALVLWWVTPEDDEPDDGGPDLSLV
jgi:hypothetical protein